MSSVYQPKRKELALVRLTTKKPNATQLKYYKSGDSYFKHFVEIEDIKGNPYK